MRKGKGLFITATGTDVGKTYVTALILKKLRENGYRAGYYKAALSGAIRTESGLLAGDAAYVRRIAQMKEPVETMVSYVYEAAVSPHLASRMEGNPVELSRIKEDYANACKRYDYVTMEGSGGIICPIRYDESCQLFLENIISELSLGALVVADGGLGTINATLLTLEYLKKREIAVKGIILNRFQSGDVMQEDNRRMIEALSGIPVTAVVSDGCTDLSISPEVLISLYQ